MAAQKLIDGIVELSEGETWDEAKEEWSLIDVFLDDEPTTCMCGKYPIHENCIIQNRHNGNKTTVGNHCVKNFLGLPSDVIFAGLKRISEDRSKALNGAAIEHAYKKGWLTDWEYDFCTRTMSKRKLTDKAHDKRYEINTKVLKMVSRSSPSD